MTPFSRSTRFGAGLRNWARRTRAAEVQATGKYEKRLYTTPDFGDWQQKAQTMNAFKGHYLVIDAPPVDPASFFAKYFATCVPVYQDADKYMHATLYDCRKAPPIVL
jgi:hypothetical protein